MGYIAINIGPILAATLVGILLGAAYAGIVRRSGDMLRRPVWLLATFLAEFWLASILAGALILAPNEAGRWVMALGSAVVIWIGFVLPSLVVSYGFRGQPVGATLGDAAHWLVVMVAQAAVLETIGLAHP